MHYDVWVEILEVHFNDIIKALQIVKKCGIQQEFLVASCGVG